MVELQIDSLPTLDRPAVVVGFSGWPDAGEVASGAVAYLIRTLGASRFAWVDPEQFFVFGEARPSTLVAEPGGRVLTWPSCEFFSARDPSGRDLVLFLGREPGVRWRAFVATVLDLAERLGGSPVFALGSTYDRVSHRGPAQVSAWSPTAEIRHTLETMGVRFSAYEGPSGIQSALKERCRERGLPAASLWGHAPH
jgi:proteasome assembly chaperone (PAC2) family protein